MKRMILTFKGWYHFFYGGVFIKAKFINKLLCYILVTFICLSSIIVSYNDSVAIVYASSEDDDLAVDLLLCVLGVGGIIVSAPVSTSALLITGGAEILNCFRVGTHLSDYITDNGDGTVTISEQGIQATIDAIEQYEKCNGFDKNDVSNMGINKFAYNYLINGSYLWGGTDEQNIYKPKSFSSSYRYAMVHTVSRSSVGEPTYYAEINYFNGREINRETYTSYIVAIHFRHDIDTYPMKVYANFPIFSNYDDARAYLIDGTGYEKALNYMPVKYTPKRSSHYSSNYSGGSRTFKKSKLNNFVNYYADVVNNNTDTDKIVKIINDYLNDDEAQTETETETETLTGGSDLTDTNNWLKKIYIRIGDFMKQVKQSADDIVKQLKAIKRWSAVDAVAGIADAVADWLDFLKNFFDDIGSGVSTLASGFSDTATLITKKFPFSIPWDIAFLIGFLADSPDTPIFELPFTLPKYGINEKLVIDFSQFSALSKISRMLLTMIFIIGLLKLTSNIIQNKKGE